MATEDYNLSASELDRKGEILVQAEEIKADDKIYRAVTKHMLGKAQKIKRIADLRDKMANEDLSEKNDRMPNKKENNPEDSEESSEEKDDD
jgi:hypothetical protein